MRRLLALLVCCLVAGCIPAGQEHRPPSYQRPAPPPPAPPHHILGAHPNADVRQCEVNLDRAGATFTPLADQYFGPSCSAVGALQLSEIAPGIGITNTKALRCEVALPLSRWVEGPVQAAAQRWFGSQVVRVESMGSYSCRNVIGNNAVAGKLSEHAHANAVDVGGFVLASGRRVTVLNGWRGNDDEAGFLHEIHDAACRSFITVLSPDYNAAHQNHLHFDMGGSQFCR